ncbi:MAG TPA: DUF1376 domain-containing protein [Candidatus Sulfopaludibacter sp.]|nr:DUF1376 domain-containing protein [Candidatus Sulfopaludibacter sp.]
MEKEEDFFKFYSRKWLDGTSEMTLEEKGLYMELLANQHLKGSLPSDTKRLCKVARMSELEFLKIWDELSKKFILDTEGRYFNLKLKKVISADTKIFFEGDKLEYKLWTHEKKNFFAGGDWIFKFCSDKNLKLEDFEESAKEFISDIELKEDYKEVKELRRHFINWYNLKIKHHGNKSNNTKSGRNSGALQLLEEIKRDAKL